MGHNETANIFFYECACGHSALCILQALAASVNLKFLASVPVNTYPVKQIWFPLAQRSMQSL